jgi:hypothetical protein
MKGSIFIIILFPEKSSICHVMSVATYLLRGRSSGALLRSDSRTFKWTSDSAASNAHWQLEVDSGSDLHDGALVHLKPSSTGYYWHSASNEDDPFVWGPRNAKRGWIVEMSGSTTHLRSAFFADDDEHYLHSNAEEDSGHSFGERDGDVAWELQLLHGPAAAAAPTAPMPIGVAVPIAALAALPSAPAGPEVTTARGSPVPLPVELTTASEIDARLTVGEKIGSGGHDVHRGTYRGPGGDATIDVAIKIFAFSASETREFEWEVQQLRALASSVPWGVARLVCWVNLNSTRGDRDEGKRYIVLELAHSVRCGGRLNYDLETWLDVNPEARTLRSKLRICHRVAMIMQSVAAAGCVHGDLDLGQVLMMAPVGGGGESSSETTAALIDVLKVSDFGEQERGSDLFFFIIHFVRALLLPISLLSLQMGIKEESEDDSDSDAGNYGMTGGGGKWWPYRAALKSKDWDHSRFASVEPRSVRELCCMVSEADEEESDMLTDRSVTWERVIALLHEAMQAT